MAEAAERQVEEAKRSAKAAQESAEVARRQLELQLASMAVGFTVVLMMRGDTIGPDTEYPWLQLRWNGPQVLLERLVATKWASVLGDQQVDPNQFSNTDVELKRADGSPLHKSIGPGESLLFDWAWCAARPWRLRR